MFHSTFCSSASCLVARHLEYLGFLSFRIHLDDVHTGGRAKTVFRAFAIGTVYECTACRVDLAAFHRSVCRADNDAVCSLTVAIALDFAIRDGLVCRRIAFYKEEAAYIRAEHTQRNHCLGCFQRVALLKLDIRKIPSVPFSASAFPYGQGNRFRYS